MASIALLRPFGFLTTKVRALPCAAPVAVGGAVLLIGVLTAGCGGGASLAAASGKPLDSESGSDSLAVASSPTPASRPSVAVSPKPKSTSVTGSPRAATASPAVRSSAPAGALPPATSSSTPLAGGNYAGSLILDDTGSRLTSWNQTSSVCDGQSWEVPDGIVSTDSSGDATVETTSTVGSCVGLVSPAAYASNVIEASIDFPALPSKPNTIANWTTFWLGDLQPGTSPMSGELDAAEVEPNVGFSTVNYHWGTTAASFRVSTGGGPAGYVLPAEGPNLTPGWHVVDIVYTSGFFAVYYDGSLYASYKSSVITGDALNIIISSAVTPNTTAIQQALDGPPINSDSSSATLVVKYVKIWSYK
jgi:hypothetical protein